MKAKYWALALLLVNSFAASAIAQDKLPASAPRAESQRRHEPPPQAYTDCNGKKVGAVIEHTTPEGRVAATCQESPKGLVARPNQPKGPPPGTQTK